MRAGVTALIRGRRALTCSFTSSRPANTPNGREKDPLACMPYYCGERRAFSPLRRLMPRIRPARQFWCIALLTRELHISLMPRHGTAGRPAMLREAWPLEIFFSPIAALEEMLIFHSLAPTPPMPAGCRTGFARCRTCIILYFLIRERYCLSYHTNMH